MDRKTAEAKARALVSRMTLREKASQLRFDSPAIERLGIPAYNWWNEALHGVARGGTATSFPQAIGLAAMFDDELVEKLGDVASTEGRAKFNQFSKKGDRDIYHGLSFWSPNINIFRDPRWGRGHETYGEDPYLTSEMGKRFVKGIQGDGEYMLAAACAKHFAVHSGPEAIRHEFDAVVSEKDLNETYLPAFKALVIDAQVEAVMGAYNRTDGEPCCASRKLMGILRGDWGFQGHFVSDCWAIKDFHMHHKVTATAEESAALALKVGCDVNCGDTYLYLLQALNEGLIDEEDITRAVVRLYTTRYLLGIMPGQHTEYDEIPYNVVACREHLAVSERAALESAVLLKNNGVLPLDKSKLNSLSIIGPNADSRDSLTGNYHGTASEYITVAQGIRRYLENSGAAEGADTASSGMTTDPAAPGGIRLYMAEGSDISKQKFSGESSPGDRLAEAAALVEYTDAAILVLGLNEFLEGEENDPSYGGVGGDKKDIYLPEIQQKLMVSVGEAAKKAGKPVILILMAGSDLDLSYAEENFDAILDMWYPGERGGIAAAKLLFGDVSPSGKLPVTFYRPDDELPEFTDYAMSGRTYRYMKTEAQYPFGFGLTYGDVSVEKAEIVPQENAEGDSADKDPEHGDKADASLRDDLLIHAVLRNDGEADTDEVLQVYIKPLDAPDDADLNSRLCAFRRVRVSAGAREDVSIRVSGKSLLTVNANGVFEKQANRYAIFVGISQPDSRSTALTGHAPIRIDL